MKKICLNVFLILVICLSMFTFVGCNKKASNEFVLGLDDSFPPLGFRDENDNVVGYDIDLASEVCTRLGMTLKCQPINWSTKEQELNTDKITCIWNGLSVTPERQEAMLLTKPYLNNAQVVVVKGDSGFSTLADLAGKTIGIQAGSSAEDALSANETFKSSLKSIVPFKENITALNDLQIGNLDGVVMDLVVAMYNIRTTNRNFVILDEDLGSEEYAVAFKRGNDKLMNSVQNTLYEMQNDGTVTKISNKWFGRDLSVIGK